MRGQAPQGLLLPPKQWEYLYNSLGNIIFKGAWNCSYCGLSWTSNYYPVRASAKGVEWLLCPSRSLSVCQFVDTKMSTLSEVSQYTSSTCNVWVGNVKILASMYLTIESDLRRAQKSWLSTRSLYLKIGLTLSTFSWNDYYHSCSGRVRRSMPRHYLIAFLAMYNS